MHMRSNSPGCKRVQRTRKQQLREVSFINIDRAVTVEESLRELSCPILFFKLQFAKIAFSFRQQNELLKNLNLENLKSQR